MTTLVDFTTPISTCVLVKYSSLHERLNMGRKIDREVKWRSVFLPTIPLCHRKRGSHHGHGLYLVNTAAGLSVPASVSCSAARPSPRCINAPCRCCRRLLTRFPVATSSRLSQSTEHEALVQRSINSLNISSLCTVRGVQGITAPIILSVPLFNTQHPNYITWWRRGRGGGLQEASSSTNGCSIKCAF